MAPELEELKEMAILETAIDEAASQFEDTVARAEHEAASEKLRQDPTPANVEKLKMLGSLAEKLEHYGVEHRKLRRAAQELRRNAFPLIERVTRRVTHRIMQLGETAVIEEKRFFKSWGVEAPAESMILPHVHRAAQEFTQNLAREKNVPVPTGVGLRGFLRMLGVE